MGNDLSDRPSRVTRALSFLLTLGLGASLAIAIPPHWAGRTPRRVTITDPPAPKILLRDVVIASPPVSPSDSVTAVIMANRRTIQDCAQRLLPRDLVVGEVKLTIQLVIGISGRVVLARPATNPRLRALDPCIREAVSRWVFPRKDERYWVEFAFALQASPADPP